MGTRVVRLAIDAANFARDRRGMGRLARPVVHAACADAGFAVTLLARPRDATALRAQFPLAAVRASASARREGYDVVWFPFNGMRFPVAAPAIVTINDAFAFTAAHPERLARYREQTPIRRAAREASSIVTISQWSRSEIARELAIPIERIDVVAPEPDAFWFPDASDPVPEPFATSRYALVVGAGEARKNVRIAIDACARAFEHPAELLVVVGTLAEADLSFARGLGVRCGEIAASDSLLRSLYRNAAVVLVPSLAEGFGLVAVEAMACGAPVLAANATALAEATGDAATLLDPNDVVAWAEAIRTLLDDDVAVAAARARSIARFTSVDRGSPTRRMLALLARAGTNTTC